MIRLIATDLDGTLLERDGTMPEGIFEIVRELNALGIRFVAASGRQLGNLKRLFAPVAREIDYVCENGAVIAIGGEVADVAPIPRAMALEILDDIEAEGMDALLSGRHTCYATADNRAFSDGMVYSLRNTMTIVDDLRAIPEDFVKMSGHLHNGVAEVAPRLTAKWGSRLTATISGRNWFDFTVSDKGKGMRMLMERLGVRRDDVAAFGDQYNDVTMLDFVGYSYLMAHADPALRKPRYTLCEKVVPVLREIVRTRGDLPESGNRRAFTSGVISE